MSPEEIRPGMTVYHAAYENWGQGKVLAKLPPEKAHVQQDSRLRTGRRLTTCRWKIQFEKLVDPVACFAGDLRRKQGARLFLQAGLFRKCPAKRRKQETP